MLKHGKQIIKNLLQNYWQHTEDEKKKEAKNLLGHDGKKKINFISQAALQSKTNHSFGIYDSY